MAEKKPLILPARKIFEEALRLYQEHWRKIISLMLFYLVILVPFGILWLAQKMGSPTLPLLLLKMSILIIALFLMAYVYLWVMMALLLLMNDFRADIKEIFLTARKKVWSYLWVMILVGVIGVVGLFLFIIPGIILSVMFSFAIYVLAFENVRGFEALKRSRELVRGFWWTVFVRFLVLRIFFTLVTLVLSIPFVLVVNLFGNGILKEVVSQAGGFIIYFLLVPLEFLSGYILYREIKHAKEKGETEASSHLSAGKKFLVGFVIAIPVLLIVALIIFLVAVKMNEFKLQQNNNRGDLAQQEISIDQQADLQGGRESQKTGSVSKSQPSDKELEEFMAEQLKTAKGRDSLRAFTLTFAESALKDYYKENQSYPSSLLSLIDYNNKKSFMKIEEANLKDPKTGEFYDYETSENDMNYKFCLTLETKMKLGKREADEGLNCFGPEDAE